MADIELVIKISEEVYNSIQDNDYCGISNSDMYNAIINGIPLPNCKDCKYFEYDSVAKVDGIPLIVAHEICKKWGDGCKTSEDGY